MYFCILCLPHPEAPRFSGLRGSSSPCPRRIEGLRLFPARVQDEMKKMLHTFLLGEGFGCLINQRSIHVISYHLERKKPLPSTYITVAQVKASRRCPLSSGEPGVFQHPTDRLSNKHPHSIIGSSRKSTVGTAPVERS